MVRMNLENLTYNHDDLSAQDLWDFKDHSGGMDIREFAEMLQRDVITEENFTQYLRQIIAFVWIIVRKDNPGVTFDDVAKHPMLPLFSSVSAVRGDEPKPRRKAAAKAA